MIKTLLLSIIFFTAFVFKTFAATISGTYYGENCGNSCKPGNLLEDPLKMVEGLITNIFGSYNRNVTFFIDQINDKDISILFLDPVVLI